MVLKRILPIRFVTTVENKNNTPVDQLLTNYDTVIKAICHLNNNVSHLPSLCNLIAVFKHTHCSELKNKKYLIHNLTNALELTTLKLLALND